jgi:hypothetical protein
MQCVMAVVALSKLEEDSSSSPAPDNSQKMAPLAGPDAKLPRQSRTVCAVAWQCRINLNTVRLLPVIVLARHPQ